MVPECRGTTWRQIDNALKGGFRRLPGGLSVAQLLAKHRGVRNRGDLPKLTELQIVRWADAHLAQFGDWPREKDRSVLGAAGADWHTIGEALRQGGRGLRAGQTLAR